jgi:hypothetical protein
MTQEPTVDPDIRILKQHIDRAADELQQIEGGTPSGLGSLIYLGSHQDAIPRNLLLDPLLESGEIHTWALLKIQLVNPALPSSIPRQDELMEILKCSRPVLSRHLQVLRATRWITLCAEVRGRDGQFKGHVYAQHDKPLSLQETLFLDPDYIRFLEQPSSSAVLKRLRQVKQGILMHMDYQMLNGMDLNRHPTDLEQSLGRLKTALNSGKPDHDTNLAYPGFLYGYGSEGDEETGKILDHPSMTDETDREDEDIKDDATLESPVDNSPIKRLDERKLNADHHVKSFYMVKSGEKAVNHRVKNHVKNFYMDTRSSSSYIKTTTTTHTRLKFPKALASERLRIWAAKMLSALDDESQQQFALDYLTDRIKAGEKGTDKPVGNPMGFLGWIVDRMAEGNLPPSSYGLRQELKNTTPDDSVGDEEDRRRNHEAWVISMRKLGVEVDPETGLVLKRRDLARG